MCAVPLSAATTRYGSLPSLYGRMPLGVTDSPSTRLSVTDNLVDGESVTPKGILPYKEGSDPYLVVAADKGTAHMSDTANRVSAAHGFWLDDAFASGGSAGYDHKVTG